MKKALFIPIIYLFTITGYGTGLTDDLVLYLPFTGNYADSSGSGYTVTNTGATLARDRFGNENSAYYFNGGSI